MRYLMQRDMTPYDFDNEGRLLRPATMINTELKAGQYSHYYVFLPENNARLDLFFSDAPLEFALFRGMEMISDGYQPLADTSQRIEHEGVYTLVVRRIRMQDVETTIDYTLEAEFTSAGEVTQSNLRDESIGQMLAEPPQIVEGQTFIRLPSAAVRLHVGAATAVASRQGQSAQLIFDGNSILIGGWAQHIALLGGDLAARGDERIVYVQDYGYRVRNIDPALGRLDTSNNARLLTDWQIIKGVWMTRTCAGFKLNDGRTFTAPVQPETRQAAFNGSLDNFTAVVNTATIEMNWRGIEENSETRIEEGVFKVNLIGDRRLNLQASTIRLFRRIDPNLNPNTPLDITLPQRDITMTLDWVNLGGFSLLDETMTFDFLDAPRGSVERSAINLQRVEALDDVIVIQYQAGQAGQGEQRLLLPASEGYLEIVTPAGSPPPPVSRALNNTGGECYPVNTLLEEANCPPNGHPNPANGNLWYAVTDLVAYGYRIDLTLTRSYNSAAAPIDGPFGRGWTTPYLIDYNVPFDATTGSRVITPDNAYRTGLDITWAPRGVVTFTTASGSRHTFTGDNGQFKAATMPGWTLQRATIRAGWTLRQPDGLLFEFDRAGRIIRYGYPSRLIEIQYERGSLNGTAGQTVTISDDFTQRQLELVFDDQHHIRRSLLRDLTGIEAPVETGYTYQHGLLTGVTYSDGREAVYTYDEAGLLTAHRDPRAPVAPDMTYTYANGGVQTITITNEGESLLWRSLSASQNRAVTVTDERGNTRTYQYNADDTLKSVTSPLSALPGIDGLPTEYTWSNGLLTQINAKTDNRDAGRNSTQFEYTAAGQLRRINGGYLETVVRFGTNGLPENVQNLTYSYDERGFPQTITDPQGAVYRAVWDERGWLRSLTRQNDGLTWDYEYNSFGMVSRLTRGGFSVGYTWNAYGQLTGIQDPLLGDYTVRYARDEITVIDAAGVEEITRYDERGRIIETRLHAGTDLRRTVYTYDVFDRMTSQTVGIEDEAVTTVYTYENLLYLPQQPGDESQVVQINGYRLTITDPYGRSTTYFYDALDRLRLIEDPLRHITRYDYFAEDAAQTNGLRIVQRDIRGNTVITTTIYEFDARWQLREVNRVSGGDTLSWRFSTDGDPSRLRFMEAISSDIRTLTWETDTYNRVTGVQINPVAVELESNAPQPGARIRLAYDFLGRIVQRDEVSYAYCLLENGAHQILEGTSTCGSTSFTQAVTYDAHDRITRIENAHGVETRTYQREGQSWRVESNTGEILIYNPAGDLSLWTDTNGFTRRYIHDSLGHLRQVLVENEPEASFTFEYNAIGQVTRSIDGTERGTLFQYDERGLLLVEQDILTGDATTYAYGPYGEMTSFISPLGSTTSFLYEDPGDPTRLTGLIDPTGVTQQFAWDDAENLLTYTDPRGGVTRYRFDGLGALRRIDDAAGSSHELRYDNAMRLREWATAQRGQTSARTLLFSAPENGQVSVSELSLPDWLWRFAYNPLGELIQITDPAGYAMTMDYGGYRQLTQITAGERVWSLDREEASLIVNDTPLTFDSLYRLTSGYTYTAGQRGRVELTVQRDGERTYTFSPGDDSSRPRTVTLSAPGQTMTYVYNAEGFIDRIETRTCTGEDCNAWVTTTGFSYDAVGRLTRVVDAEQHIKTFAYDESGNLISYQSANGKTFTYQYDILNHLTAITGPTGLRLLLSYDALGNVTGICRARSEPDYDACARNGNVLETYTYDRLGRLISQQFPNIAAQDDTTLFTHTYDRGRLTSWGLANGEQVSLSYSEDILSLLDALDTGTSYQLAYDQALRLTSVNDSHYQYDEIGRLQRQNESSYSFDYAYAPDHRGFTVTETNSGAFLSFLLEQGGWLSSMDYGAEDRSTLPEETPLLSLDYLLNQPNILTVLSNSRDSALTFDFQLDRLSQTLNLVFNYGDTRLLADYLINPVGRVTRQRINAVPVELFAPGASGYITVTGYDDDDRVSTVRITDRTSGELLYVLNFTYNAAGQRSTETHRYADGTQMNIEYEYSEPSQLTRRVVSIVRAQPLTSLLPLAALWMLAARKRRSLLLLSGAVVLIFTQIQGQQGAESYVYLYTHDAAGNLARVELQASATRPENQICAEYEYDSANRLTRVTQNGRQYVYTYDVHNRLTGASNWNVIYGGDAPLMAYNRAGLTAFYGRLEDHPPLFIAEGNRVKWLLPDGRDRFMTTAQQDNVAPLTLLDPLGRPLSVTLPDEIENPCSLTPQMSTLFNLPQPQITFAGMLWDPMTNLYFKDGRAYLPDIARFLQRDTQGVGVFGLVYDLSLRSPVPTLYRRPFEIASGLRSLKHAVEITQKQPTASTIKAQFYPANRTPNHWWDSLGQPDESFEQIERLAALPAWLQTGYHHSGAGVDGLSSALRFARSSAPGFAQSHPSSAGLIPSPFEVVRDTSLLPAISPYPAASYEPFRWIPEMASLATPVMLPQLAAQPGDVMAWLPQPLTAPHTTVPVLDLLAGLERLPQWTGREFLNTLLEDALPALPQLPPESVDEWQARWFDEDPFGLNQALAQRHPVPAVPEVPLYDIGVNLEWLHLR